MVQDDVDALKGLGNNATYPLPPFYEKIFGQPKTQWAQLAQAELLQLGHCRLGEYIINECM